MLSCDLKCPEGSFSFCEPSQKSCQLEDALKYIIPQIDPQF